MSGAVKKFPHHRNYERAQVDGRVFIHDDGHLFIAPLSNLGVGGLFVDKLVSLGKGSAVRVVIKSSKFAEPILAKGKVVRVEKQNRTGSAVQFEWLNEKSKELIENYIKQNGMEDVLKVA